MYNIYNIEHPNMLNNIMRRHLELQHWQARGSTSRALNDKTAAKSTNYHVPHHLANQANLALYIIIFTGVNISPTKSETVYHGFWENAFGKALYCTITIQVQ